MKELICIVCPKGCCLHVDESNDYAVTGNGCARGAMYGRTELTNPTRVVTSTVCVSGAELPRCPVKTNRAIPKEKVFKVMECIASVRAQAPITAGRSADDREAFSQIVQNIVDVLQPHGQADKSQRDARGHKLLFSGLAVRVAGQMQYTGVDIRHMHHLIGKRQAAHKFDSHLAIATDGDRNHTTAPM